MSTGDCEVVISELEWPFFTAVCVQFRFKPREFTAQIIDEFQRYVFVYLFFQRSWLYTMVIVVMQ